MLLQELFKGQQLLRNALDHVQSVDAKHDLPSRVPIQQLRDVGPHARRLERRGEPVWVDADREGRYPRHGPVVLHARRRPFETENPCARRHEMSRVVVRVEPDQVRLEHRPQQLLPHRQRPVDLRRRERRVKKEPDLHPRVFLFENGRQRHQVIVLDPDDVPRPVVLQDDVGEQLVRVLMRLPLEVQRPRLRQLRINVQRHVMEQLPQHRVAKPVVVQVAGVLVHKHGRIPLVLHRFGQRVPLRTLLDVHAGPPDPNTVTVPDAHQRRHETARADLQLPPPVLPLERRHGQPIRDDDQPPLLLPAVRHRRIQRFGMDRRFLCPGRMAAAQLDPGGLLVAV